MMRHAETYVEIYCELAEQDVSHLKQVETPLLGRPSNGPGRFEAIHGSCAKSSDVPKELHLVDKRLSSIPLCTRYSKDTSDGMSGIVGEHTIVPIFVNV